MVHGVMALALLCTVGQHGAAEAWDDWDGVDISKKIAEILAVWFGKNMQEGASPNIYQRSKEHPRTEACSAVVEG